MDKSIPAGYHFLPTDAELITHYLNRKIPDEALSTCVPVIKRDVYASEPWNIFNVQQDPCEIANTSDKSDKKTAEHVFYVLTKLKMISKNRVSRTVGCGTWKGQTTGKEIKNRNNEVIGFKKMLVFETKNKGKEIDENNTHWIMHEYSLKEIVGAGDYVLCKIKRVELKKPEKKRRFEEISECDHRDGINETRGENIEKAQKIMRSQEDDTNGNHKISFDAMNATPLTMIHVPDIPPLLDEDDLNLDDIDFGGLGEFDLDFGSADLDHTDGINDTRGGNIGEAQKIMRSQEDDINGNHKISFDAMDATPLTMIHVPDIPPLPDEDNLNRDDADFGGLSEFDLDFGSADLDFGLGGIDFDFDSADLDFGSANLDFGLGDIDLDFDSADLNGYISALNRINESQLQEANESQTVSSYDQPKTT